MDIDAFLADLVGRRFDADRRIMQRGVGDTLECIAGEHLAARLASVGVRTTPAASRRSIEDLRVFLPGRTVYLDVKTFDVEATFSMPNLVSVKRLRQLYESPGTELRFAFLSYRRRDTAIEVLSARTLAVEEIDPACLAVQNLGLGQLQLRDARRLEVTTCGRAAWMAQFRAMVIAFHQQQLAKTARELASWRLPAEACGIPGGTPPGGSGPTSHP